MTAMSQCVLLLLAAACILCQQSISAFQGLMGARALSKQCPGLMTKAHSLVQSKLLRMAVTNAHPDVSR